ncbi:unnamed protein product, partial [Allacma fusca]
MSLKLFRDPKLDWGYHTTPQKHLKGHPNNRFMLNRGKGDDSWTYQNLLPFFKRMENYNGNFPNDDLHGRNGPLSIESPEFAPL